jgi:hypothetical protein
MSDAPPPRGLSAESRKRWVALHAAFRSDWRADDEITCEQWLRLEDRAAKLWKDGKVAESVKVATLAHRWHRGLKFIRNANANANASSPANNVRKLGRPADRKARVLHAS